MKNRKVNIQYLVHPQLFEQYYKILYQQLLPNLERKRICELGTGANPSLTAQVIEERQLDYWVTDIFTEALENLPENYQRKVLNVQQQEIIPSLGKFDLIFSKMLVEYLPNTIFPSPYFGCFEF